MKGLGQRLVIIAFGNEWGNDLHRAYLSNSRHFFCVSTCATKSILSVLLTAHFVVIYFISNFWTHHVYRALSWSAPFRPAFLYWRLQPAYETVAHSGYSSHTGVRIASAMLNRHRHALTWPASSDVFHARPSRKYLCQPWDESSGLVVIPKENASLLSWQLVKMTCGIVGFAFNRLEYYAVTLG